MARTSTASTTRLGDEGRRILEALPRLLRRDKNLKAELWKVLDRRFATKTEIARLLREMDRSRRVSEARFKAVDRRFDALVARMDQFGKETHARFETIVAEIRHLRETHKADMAQMRESQKADLAEMRATREADLAEARATREADLAEARASREAMVAQMRGIREELIGMMRDLENWVSGVVGGFQVRAGRNLEDMVAGTLRVALKMKDVDPSKITLRRKITDTQGRIGPAGRTYEVDILARNGETWIFEIKSVPDVEDIERFNDKAELARHELGLTQLRKAVITLAKVSEVTATCQTLGIEVG